MKKIFLIIAANFCLVAALQAQFSIKADFRARGEYRDGARVLLDSSMNPTGVFSQRTRLITNFKKDRFEFNVAFQNARIWGEDPDRTNTGNVNLAEGWVKYHMSEELNKFTLKIGRQHLVFDDGRIFGMRNWNDIAVSHDLVLFEMDHKGWNVRSGMGYNNDGNKFMESAYDVNFYRYLGVIWVNKKLSEEVNISLLNSVDGNEDETNFKKVYPRFTSGIYFERSNDDKPLSLVASAYHQYGKSPEGLDLNAYMFSVIPTYKINKKIKVALGVNYFSGNNELSSDQDTERSFNKLFGDGHRYYGYMDYFLNIQDNTQGGGMREMFTSFFYKTGERSNLELSYHNFALAGTLLDPSLDASEPQLGSEIDIQFKHKINSYLSLTAAYATMFATESMEIIKGGDHERYQQWATIMLIAKPELFTTKEN